MTITEAISYYDDLLREGHAAACAEQLARGMERQQIAWNGAPVCRVLRPMFVGARELQAARHATELVLDGVRLMYARVAGDAALRARVLGTPDLVALAEFDRGEPTSVGVAARLDGFHARNGELQFIEYNCFPGGIIQSDVVGELFEDTEVFRRWRERFRVRRSTTRGRVVEALRRAYGGDQRGLPAVGYLRRHLDDDFKAAGQEMPIHARNHVEAGGVAVFGSADEFELRGERLACRGQVVDVIGCDDWPDLIAATRLGHPVFHAARRGQVRFLNGMCLSLVLGSKLFFALLSDEAETAGMPAETRRALARHLPWTRHVRDTMTTYDGAQIDLLPFVAARRRELVLKPAFGHGGQGVVIGHTVDDAAWQDALRRCATVPHVVQALVEAPAQAFPIMHDGELAWIDYFSDFDPYVWNTDEMAGVVARLSEQAVLNVSAGGSMAPVFVLE